MPDHVGDVAVAPMVGRVRTVGDPQLELRRGYRQALLGDVRVRQRLHHIQRRQLFACQASGGQRSGLGFVAGHANTEAITVTSAGFTMPPPQTTSGSGSTTASVISGYESLRASSGQSFTATFTTAMIPRENRRSLCRPGQRGRRAHLPL